MRHYQHAVPAQISPRLVAMKRALRNSSGSPNLSEGVPARMAEVVARSDTQIKQDIKDELRSEPSIDAASIGVEVKNGIVTLTGRANGSGEKWLIETAARRIAGVKSLTVKLETIVPGSGVRTDDDIGRECENALGVTVPGPNQGIKVMVSNGWVTLSGDVAWGYERWAAEAVVSGLVGVTGVNCQIKVRPLVVESNANANIEAALSRQPKQEFHDVETEVDCDQGTLSGNVHSWAERELRVMRPILRLPVIRFQ